MLIFSLLKILDSLIRLIFYEDLFSCLNFCHVCGSMDYGVEMSPLSCVLDRERRVIPRAFYFELCLFGRSSLKLWSLYSFV